MDVIVTFISLLTWVLIIAIFIRVMLSWLPMTGGQFNPLIAIIYQITEPILAPLRRVIPRLGIFDLTPTIALFILIAIQRVASELGK